MKKLSAFLLAMVVVVTLVGCNSKKEATADYTTAEAETALNDGKDLVGKTVKVKVDTFIEDGPLGHTIQAGDHLNFISSKNPKVKDGDELVVKITKVEDMLGSFIISYDKQ
ncbi:hypothetical protein [Isobaculum melis]|nr:hypothetical protein [Isobaculum melis]